MELKRMSFKHKNNKIAYYAKNFLRQLIPSVIFQKKYASKIKDLKYYDEKEIFERVNFYNKLVEENPIEGGKIISELKINENSKVYYFDFYEFGRYFKSSLKGHFLFGDITHIPEVPSLTKSRPISDTNQNSVVMNFDKVRHFIFIKKDKPYDQKLDKMIWRGKVYVPHRIKFLEMHHDNPLCNIARVNKNDLNSAWLGDRLTISEHLNYKFILAIEGIDVASNLKWVMSSNSVAVMPKPKYETWFMESKLIPDYHYISIKEDYSDLEERLKYFIAHPKKAKAIIKNAHDYIVQFQDKRKEDLISLLVLKKYFEKTNQM